MNKDNERQFRQLRRATGVAAEGKSLDVERSHDAGEGHISGDKRDTITSTHNSK